MNHVIISSVLLVAAIAAKYLYYIFTLQWQSIHADEIEQFKKKFGNELTLFPKGHSTIERIFAISIIGLFLYLIIAILILIFA